MAARGSLLFLALLLGGEAFTTLPTTRPLRLAKSLRAYEDGEPQVLRFLEPNTGRPVVLVGCMHYNPASIEKARSVTEELAREGQLRAVVLESCQTRWDAGERLKEEMSPFQLKLYSYLLRNEMQAAGEVARQNGVAVLLGDQPIEVTDERVKETVMRTLRELLNPFGGWAAIINDLRFGVGALGFAEEEEEEKEGGANDAAASSSFSPSSASSASSSFASAPASASAPAPASASSASSPPLSIRDFGEEGLLLSMPVSLVRYPLALAVRYPQFVLSLALGLAVLDQGPRLLLDALDQAILLSSASASAGAGVGVGGGADIGSGIGDVLSGALSGLGSGAPIGGAPIGGAQQVSSALGGAAGVAEAVGRGVFGGLFNFFAVAFAEEDSVESWTASVAIAVLETAVLGRAMVLPILGERNYALARAIAAACEDEGGAGLPGRGVRTLKKDQEGGDHDGAGGAGAKFGDGSDRGGASDFEPVAALDYPSWSGECDVRSLAVPGGPARGDGAVVAILGMAHCNGVRQLLLNGGYLEDPASVALSV